MNGDSTFNELKLMSERLARARAKEIRTVEDALNIAFIAYTRLKELGFREGCYAPRDGTPFETVSMGSTGIHRCTYATFGDDGYFMFEDGGDIYPMRERPLLFRPIKDAGV